MKDLLHAALQAPTDPAVERILREGFFRAARSSEGVVVVLSERRRR